ncbi:sensor domain-containing protein [Prauserella cavernicola]|uniref:Sensor domain-containing protein n=1 Tax=Prauserella cavernicola TaxID=2800127 RepID=A0A934V837_9PSEU|nr:sensor domain-containing protein [Prauserella cavernicola]MBK1789252.1 sensor domain-containing protein [Prauserella cavernicola]
MNPARTESGRRPSIGGSVAYLLLNLPVGIVGFVFLVTMLAVGVSTAIIWVGVPLLAVTILATRGAARLERARIYALLDSYIHLPYRPLPEEGQKERWKARLKDSATWKDVTYFLLLFPIGIAQFVITVTLWAAALGLTTLPIYYRFLPEGAYYFPAWDVRWFTVDSVVSALPWAALGVLLLGVSAVVCRGIATAHARFAELMLGPGREREESDASFPGTATMSPVAG